MRTRRLFKEGFKAGYKKALAVSRHKLNEARGMTPEKQEVFDTFIRAVYDCKEEGVKDPEGIIDYWQQVHGDDALYGYNGKSLSPYELADLCAAAFEETGVYSGLNNRGLLKNRRNLVKIFQGYIDTDNSFQAGF